MLRKIVHKIIQFAISMGLLAAVLIWITWPPYQKVGPEFTGVFGLELITVDQKEYGVLLAAGEGYTHRELIPPREGNLVVLDMEDGEIIATHPFDKHPADIGFGLSQHQVLYLVPGDDNELFIWDTQSGAVASHIFPHNYFLTHPSAPMLIGIGDGKAYWGDSPTREHVLYFYSLPNVTFLRMMTIESNINGFADDMDWSGNDKILLSIYTGGLNSTLIEKDIGSGAEQVWGESPSGDFDLNTETGRLTLVGNLGIKIYDFDTKELIVEHRLDHRESYPRWSTESIDGNHQLYFVLNGVPLGGQVVKMNPLEQ